MSDSIEKQCSLDVSSHPRLSEFDRLVYPVVSRRAGGLSLGINLNPSKNCSFNCVYCQVDRSIRIHNLKVDIQQLTEEIDDWLDKINDKCGRFQDLTLKDISIAGDGEPTLSPVLPELHGFLMDHLDVPVKTIYQSGVKD
jgi:wyosine [tRNA(Phe)-imidazoG37] synthetase (radical SAM superfamily)